MSTEKQQTESSVSTAKPSSKRKAPEIDIFDFDISPRRRRLDTRSKKTAIRKRQGRSHIVSFVNQTFTHLDPVQRWWRRTGIKRFLMMNQTVTL